MFLAIDRVSKFVYVEFYDSPGKAVGSAFLRGVVEAFSSQIRRVLTDNGVFFTKNVSIKYDMIHDPFDCVCDENDIEHRLTKPYHPWTDGLAERMNRTVEEATTKTLHYDTADLLRAHVLASIAAYNFAEHLKALTWRTPFQAICGAWTASPAVFKINPRHLISGPYTQTTIAYARLSPCSTTTKTRATVPTSVLTRHDECMWALLDRWRGMRRPYVPPLWTLPVSTATGLSARQ